MFSDFKIKKDLERVGYKIKQKNLHLPEKEKIRNDIYENIQLFVKLFYSNEEAVKALVLTPVIVCILGQLKQRYGILYEEYIEADKDLRGRCDLIVSKLEHDDTNDTLGDKPLLVIEAKKKTVDEAISQCGAELIALHKLGKSVQYGIVSTGDDWIFLEIFPNEKIIYQNDLKFYLSDLQRISNIIISILRIL